MIYIIFILFIVFWWKIWYIVELPFIALWQYRLSKRKVSQNLPEPEFADPHLIKKTLKGQLKSIVRKYIKGSIRLHVFKTGYIQSHHLRMFVYRYVYMAKIKRKCIIYYGAELRGAHQLHIDEGSIIGDKSVLDARRGGIFIGKYVRINSNVSLWTGSHDMNDPYFRSTPDKRGPIHVGDRVWIGPNVTILHDVSIGEGAVIAAGAVVTKDVEPFTLVGGVPAKKIGERSRDLRYTCPVSYYPFL